MSDRLGNRRHPLFKHARELVASAVAAASAADTRALGAQLDAKMDTLSAGAFEEAIGMACVELRQRRGGQIAIQDLVATARDVSQTIEQDDGSTVILFGLALRLPAMVARRLSPQQVEALVRVLVSHGLLANADVTLLPLLLSPRQTNGLLAGQIYALSRALRAADLAAAERLLVEGGDDRVSVAGESGASSANEAVAVLLGVIGEKDGPAFPLPASMEAQLPAAETSAMPPVGYAFTPPKLLEELHRKLAACAGDLAQILGHSPVHVTQPAGLLTQANMHAVDLMRAQDTRALLDRLADAHGNGRLAGLVVGPVTPGEKGLSAPVYRRLDRETVGSLQWPLARYEPPQNGLLQLLTLLDELGLLEAPDDPASSRQLH
jgi:hypothetical protein